MVKSENRKLISIVSPTYNEIDNVDELYRRVFDAVESFKNYEFEYLFIDNASTDGTVEKLKQLAANDYRVKVIINNRNFGHIRSPYWGIIQTKGDATIYLASDLQDPPEYLSSFIQKWEEGYKLVLATKPVSDSTAITHWIRKSYYRFLDSIADISVLKDSTGFGLYDRQVIDQIRNINDPYPFLRGLVAELGFEVAEIKFDQPRRIRGVTKNNFYTLYDIAVLGIVSHSMFPIRVATLFGFTLGILSIISALITLALKITHWDEYPIGIAPLIITMFFMFGVILIFIGMLGEYIGSIHTYVRNRPVVVEKERINFD